MAKKFLSRTRSSTRKIKQKGGSIKVVAVKAHFNKLNRKPKKK